MIGLAVLAGLLVTAGLVLAAAGLSRTSPAREPAPTAGPAELWARWTRRPPGARGRQRDLRLLASAIGGFVLAALTGWVLLVPLAPLLAVGLPYLLLQPRARDVALLEALDRWVRSLAAGMTTGRSVTDAIRVSRRTAPPLIADEVGMLVARLNNRWDTRDALHRFADTLDSPDADAVVAALMLATDRGANGASTTLHALADSIQDQLRGRRLIETERAKPYVVVRQVTVISLVTLVAVFVLSPSFFAVYKTPTGQLILTGLISLYLGSLVLMRRKAHQAPRERVLIGRAP